MEGFINSVAWKLQHLIENATANDFGSFALAIVLLGWFFTRFGNNR